MIPDVPYHYAPQTPLVKKIPAGHQKMTGTEKTDRDTQDEQDFIPLITSIPVGLLCVLRGSAVRKVCFAACLLLFVFGLDHPTT
ncbi:MAG: hypothetical protein ABIH04_03880 [Planctomycetota bacterium]